MASELTLDELEEEDLLAGDDETETHRDGCGCPICYESLKVPGSGILVSTSTQRAEIAKHRGKFPYQHTRSFRTPSCDSYMVADTIGQHQVILCENDDSSTEDKTGSYLALGEQGLYHVQWRKAFGSQGTLVICEVYTEAPGFAKTECARITHQFPSVPDPDNDQIKVNFWSNGPHGATYTQRSLKATEPADLELNYSEETKKALKELLARTQESITGRIILLHGVPGTGKSYFIRLLLREWKKWCSGEYLLDAEQFFGVANYMTSVVFRDSEQYRMVVCEDADEFISADGKTSIGQSVSRLFNLADGMVGQGTNTLILMTTNEPISSFHKAILRPGRSLANIEFGKLSRQEAEAWMAAHECQYEPVGDMSLAECYEKLGNERVLSKKATKRSIGFGI